jgi:hypothetical protein
MRCWADDADKKAKIVVNAAIAHRVLDIGSPVGGEGLIPDRSPPAACDKEALTPFPDAR